MVKEVDMIKERNMSRTYWDVVLELLEKQEISFEDASSQYLADVGLIEETEGINKGA
jgi:hypothetical protein